MMKQKQSKESGVKKELEDEESENCEIWAEPWGKRLRQKKKGPMKKGESLSNDLSVKEESHEEQSPISRVKEEEEQEEGEGEEESTEEEEEEEFVNSGNPDTDREESPMEMCEPFSMVETKMEVNEKEHIDPSRYVIVVENQKKKRRKIKEKIRGRTRKREDGYEGKKKRQRKQNNPKKKPKKNFACDICREDLGNEEELNAHRRMRHINEKSEFFCDFCLKIFKTKAILKGHRYKHVTDPQFLCVRCGKKYFTISNLNEHSLYCLDEKKFECPVCNKKFNVNKQFKRHLVIHEADRYIKCTVCEQTFSRKDNYRQHFRRHTGEKPYTCDICGKSFRIKATYNYHRRTHRDVRTGELDGLKTESGAESDLNVFRTPRKDVPQDGDFYCPRSEGGGEFPIRIPRREGEFGYVSRHKEGGGLMSEYQVKREPGEGEYLSRKGSEEESVRKEGSEEEKGGMEFSMEYSKRETGRVEGEGEFYGRKEEYGGEGGGEYLERRGVMMSLNYQGRSEGEYGRREVVMETGFSPYQNSRLREGQE